MEEDLKVLEEFIKSIRSDLEEDSPDNWKLAQAIENLINRNKELQEQRDSLMWQRNTIDIPKIEELEEKINQIEAEKELLVLQLKAQKLYGNKITIDLENGNLPDILVKDYTPKSKVREILDTKYIAMFEGDTEFPDDATIMKTVKYVKVSDIEELLQEGDK